jgi:hypothetical protein
VNGPPRTALSPDLAPFVERLLGEGAEALGVDLYGAYVIGSVATGDLAGDASDLDLLLVHDGAPLPRSTRLATGERLADVAADCPLRGVEAVLYRAEVLAAPTYPLPIALNVNGGRDLPRRVETASEQPFWFLLDVAAARDAALTLLGPPADEAIAPIPRPAIVAALRDSDVWHRAHGGTGADAVLNAARAWCWLVTERWRSKTAAGRWLLDQPDAAPHHGITRAALAERAAGSDTDLDAAPVRALQAAVRDRLDAEPA